MALDRNRIRDLLGTGLSSEVVATAVGCDPSYISQLLAEEAFAAEVSNLRAEALTANSKRDRKIDTIEDKVIEKLEEVVDNGMVFKPADLLRTFAVVNNAKRRGVPAHESMVVNNTIVNLMIPQVLRRAFTINQQGEVIEAEGQTLVTMPARSLLEHLVRNKGGTDGDKYQKVANFLPAQGLEHGTGDK